MQRLSGLSRRYLRERRGRALLAGTGIALGVTVLFSSLLAITSFNRGLAGMRMNSPGMDVVAVPTAGGSSVTVDDAVIDEVAAAEDVDSVLRVLNHPLTLATGHEPNHTYTRSGQYLFGLDGDEVTRFADIYPLYDLTPTVGRLYTEGADEVMLSERHAEFLGVTAGDELIAPNLPGGERRLLVTGLLSDESVARRNNGELIFTSLQTVRRLTDQPGAVSWAALHLEPGTPVEPWITAHSGEDPRLRYDSAESSIADERTAVAELGDVLTLFASLILFVAGFLIYLTLSMAVAERQATLGVLRALGVSRAHLFQLVVIEAAVLGLVATTVGLVAGYGLAWFNHTFEPLGDAPFPDRGVPVTVGALAAAIGLGVVATLVAAIVPAWRAARMAPLDAIREPVGLGTGSHRRWPVGLVAFPVGLLVLGANPDDARIVGAGLFCALAGAMLLVPAVLPWLCRRLMVLAAAQPLRLVHVVVPHLSRERTRSAYTLGLAMVVMAMATAMGAALSSSTHTSEMQFAKQEDVVSLHSGPLSEDLLRRVEAVPGIEAATPTWWGRTRVPEAEYPDWLVVAIDPTTYFDVLGFAWAAGDDEDFARRLARGGQIGVAEQLARELDLSIGDEVTVTTYEGPRSFEVAGIYVTVATARGFGPWTSVIVGQQDGRDLFGFDWPATGIAGRLQPGADTDAVVEAVEDLQTDSTFVVSDDQQMRAPLDETMTTLRNVVVSILVPAALVSALGLANTLAVAVMERRREIGVLRAVGLRRSQARSLALLEAGVLVAVAAVLSIPLGYALSRPVVDVTAASFGAVLHYAFPWRWLVITAVMALVLAVVAAVAPARRAARIDVSAALRFE